MRYYALVSALALIGVMGAQFTIWIGHVRTERWAESAWRMTETAGRARFAVVERAANIRAFVATHDSTYLVNDMVVRAQLAAMLDSLIAQAGAFPERQQSRAIAITEAVQRWDSGYARPALAGTLTGAAARLADRSLFIPVEQQSSDFLLIESLRYREHLEQSLTQSNLIALGLIGPLAIMALLFWRMGSRIDQQTTALFDQQIALERQAEELTEKARALTAANVDLSATAHERDEQRGLAEQSRNAAAREHAFLDAALNSSPVGFAFFDPFLRYQRVNEALANMDGVSVEEHLGKSVRDVIPSLAPALDEMMKRVLLTGDPALGELLSGDTKSAPGQVHHFNASFYPIVDQNHTTIGVGAVISDVTSHAVLEEEFRQSQKMEAIGRLAGAVAHDFNNLLTVIQGYSDLALLDSAADDPRRKELSEIRGAADRAATLSRQLLSLSRKSTGRPRILNLNDVVRGVEAMLLRLLPKNVNADSRLADDLGTTSADPGQIEQILLNLTVNAIDAMPKGGRIVLETANATVDETKSRLYGGLPAGEYVTFSVGDTGVGMDEETKARIFEPFFTTKAPDKGTGLGLSTVRDIVERLRGFVKVVSAPGLGSTFTVFLPRVSEAASAPAEAGVTNGRQHGTETILIVEDEDSVRNTLVPVLKRHGYTPLAASRGGEALRLAADHHGPVHLVISDLMMPEMSGKEFAGKIAAARPDVRVLFMSGYDEGTAESAKLIDSSRAFISKPFTMEEILGKVYDILHPAAPAGVA